VFLWRIDELLFDVGAQSLPNWIPEQKTFFDQIPEENLQPGAIDFTLAERWCLLVEGSAKRGRGFVLYGVCFDMVPGSLCCIPIKRSQIFLAK
jgi:hypothetical protein